MPERLFTMEVKDPAGSTQRSMEARSRMDKEVYGANRDFQALLAATKELNALRTAIIRAKQYDN